MANAINTPVLAQVDTPAGPYYIPYALNHQGFVVQRHYRCLPPEEAERSNEANAIRWYEPYLQPFVHPVLLAEASLDMADVTTWLETRTGEVFIDPIYSTLCLQWGINPQGYHVRAYKPPARPGSLGSGEWELGPEPLPLFYIPHTTWGNGRIYYQLAEPIPADNWWLTQAGLAWHATNIEGEGSWQGWYTLDWAVAVAAAEAAQIPRYAALGQLPATIHYVRLYQAPGVLMEERTFPTAELAWACYAEAPAAVIERTPAGAHMYPRLTIGWKQGERRQRLYAEKAVALGVVLDQLVGANVPCLVPSTAWIPTGESLPSALFPIG